MIKLIQFELKKIFKSKFNLLLLILIFGTCFYMIREQSSRHYYPFEGENISMRTLLGITLKDENMKTIETSSNSGNTVSGEVRKRNFEG